MSQHYFDQSRENNPHALPDIETWESTIWELECSRGCGSFDVDHETIIARAPECYCPSCEYNSGRAVKTDRTGWFYWYCLPGCMPDSPPIGPFESEDAALEDARQHVE